MVEVIPDNTLARNIIQTINSWLNTKRVRRPQSEQWMCLLYTVEEIRELQRNPELFNRMYNELVELLNSHKCMDIFIVSEVFQLALFYKSNVFAPRNIYPAGRVYPYTKRYVYPVRYRRHVSDVNCVAKLMVQPYWYDGSQDIMPCDVHLLQRNDVIQWAIVTANYILVKDLLKYGVMYVSLSGGQSTWMIYCNMIRILLKTDLHALLDSQTILLNFMSLSAESRRRMFAVLKAVEVISYGMTGKEREIYLCFKLAFETIPEPFITTQEIKMFLKLCFSELFIHSIGEEMCSSYEKFFPQSAQPRTPRSLLHLARCQVRQCLREAGKLPHGIADLDIPTSLKGYVVYTGNKCILEEFKRWNFPL